MELREYLPQAHHESPFASMPYTTQHLVPFPLLASFYFESGLGNFFFQESFLCVELFQLECHYCSERSPKVSGEDLLALSRFDTSVLRLALPKISKVKQRTKSGSPCLSFRRQYRKRVLPIFQNLSVSPNKQIISERYLVSSTSIPRTQKSISCQFKLSFAIILNTLFITHDIKTFKFLNQVMILFYFVDPSLGWM